MQLCAKVGGEPWSIAELPYFTRITTVFGVYVTENQVSVVCSLNQSCTRYWSLSKMIQHSDEIEPVILSLISEGLLAFKLRVAAFPKFLFLYTTYEEFPDI